MKKVFFYPIIFCLVSCNNSSKQTCSNLETEISFLNDSVTIKFPKEWEKIDSVMFFSKAGVFHKQIMNNDTSSFGLISVDNYGVYPNVKINDSVFFLLMKAKMEDYNKGDSLIEDKINYINGHKVNFLKYLETKDKGKIYNAHIGFILQENIQVEIVLKVTETQKLNAPQLINCIFSSLTIK